MTTQDTPSQPSDQDTPNQPQGFKPQRNGKGTEEVNSDAQLKSTSKAFSPEKTRLEKFSLLGQGIGALVTSLTVIVTILGLYLSVSQFDAQQKASAMQSLDQQRQATLNGYLDNMSNSLLVYNLSASKPGDEVRVLAQAQTYEAVRNLDGTRKGTLIRFLWEAGLINGAKPIISLSGADLSGIILGGDLSGASFCVDIVIKNCVANNNVNLSEAILNGANLSGAILSGADLRGATYNTKPMQVTDAQGNSVTLEPTQWPQGFDLKNAEVICVDC